MMNIVIFSAWLHRYDGNDALNSAFSWSANSKKLDLTIMKP